MQQRLKFDIDVLANEMLDCIPEEMFISDTTTFLDPAMGGGQFIKALISRLRKYSHSDDNIASRITCYENNKMRIKFAVNKYNLIGTFEAKDFLKEDIDMKFDAIIGNPPYKESGNDSTFTNLWAQIYIKSFGMLKKYGTMGLVTPKTWATPKDENRITANGGVLDIIKNHAVSINLDECKRHFKEGSTFSYSIVTEDKSKSCEVTTPDGTVVVDPEVFCRNIINDINNISLSIFEKFRKLPTLKKEKGCSLKAKMISQEEINDTTKDEFCYPVQYAMSTIKWANEPHKLQFEKKVIFPNQNAKNYPLYDSGKSAPANRGAVYLVDTDHEGENMVDFIKTKPIQFIISQQRFHHGLLNTAVVSCIPELDYTKKWSDKDIYELLDLELEEIEYIESHVK